MIYLTDQNDQTEYTYQTDKLTTLIIKIRLIRMQRWMTLVKKTYKSAYTNQTDYEFKTDYIGQTDQTY